MQIVIEIDEGKYKTITSYPKEWDEWALNAIKIGVPLPKGHGRLIDSDALDIDNLNRAYGDNFELDFGRLYTTDVVDMIAKAPTIIEADKEDKQNEKTQIQDNL